MDDFSGVLKIVRCMQSWRDLEEVQEKGKCFVSLSNGSCLRFGETPSVQRPRAVCVCPTRACVLSPVYITFSSMLTTLSSVEVPRVLCLPSLPPTLPPSLPPTPRTTHPSPPSFPPDQTRLH